MIRSRLLKILAPASALALVAAAASAQSIVLTDNGADLFAVGGGKACVTPLCDEPPMGTQQFSLSAHSSPKGDFGKWSVKLTDADGNLVVRYTVDIDCVNVHVHPFGPHAAVIHGRVEKVEPTPNVFGVQEGTGVLLGVKDGGQSGSGLPVDDFFTAHNDAGLVDGTCKATFYQLNFNNVDSGNVEVKINQ